MCMERKGKEGKERKVFSKLSEGKLELIIWVLSQASAAQKNLGPSGDVEVMQPAQSSPSRTQAVGAASQLRTAAFKLLLMGCRSSGAAFIKWGQWSATREDIFPAVSFIIVVVTAYIGCQ